MPHAAGNLRRDPLSAGYDTWARELLDVLRGDVWEWHGRTVRTPPDRARFATDSGGLSRDERAAQRSLYWCLGHAASSGLKIRAEHSLQVAWGQPLPDPLDAGGRARLLSARVTPRGAGQRAVLIRGRGSYITHPTSRGALEGEGWKPKT